MVAVEAGGATVAFPILSMLILVPVFGSRSDDLACRRLEESAGMPAVAVLVLDNHTIAMKGGQDNSSQGVPDRDAEPSFQGFANEFPVCGRTGYLNLLRLYHILPVDRY